MRKFSHRGGVVGRRQRALERQAAEQEAVIRIVPDSKAIS